eukprot:Clim_evm243s157 gene=Clim_evmTU243s157
MGNSSSKNKTGVPVNGDTRSSGKSTRSSKKTILKRRGKRKGRNEHALNGDPRTVGSDPRQQDGEIPEVNIEGSGDLSERRSVASAKDNRDENDALQHISERQTEVPDEKHIRFGNHNRYVKSLNSLEQAGVNDKVGRTRSNSSNSNNALRRRNSCTTIYLSASVAAPGLERTLECVSQALELDGSDNFTKRDLRKSGMDAISPRARTLWSVFSEEDHPSSFGELDVSEYWEVPSAGRIFHFLNSLFEAAALTAEAAIITLIYVERLMNSTGIVFTGLYWRRITLGAVLLASKVWDDQAVWNVDFCSILPDMAVEDMNQLERRYLEAIGFNVSVAAGIYARYFFELQDIVNENDGLPTTQLNMERAIELEALTRKTESLVSKTKKGNPRTRKRPKSQDQYQRKPEPAYVM